MDIVGYLRTTPNCLCSSITTLFVCSSSTCTSTFDKSISISVYVFLSSGQITLNLDRNNKLQFLLYEAFQHIEETHWLTFAVGITSIFGMVLIKKYFKKIPATLIIVILSILVVRFFNLDLLGVAIIGEIPQGLPNFKIPVFDKQILNKLFPIALKLYLIA